MPYDVGCYGNRHDLNLCAKGAKVREGCEGFDREDLKGTARSQKM